MKSLLLALVASSSLVACKTDDASTVQGRPSLGGGEPVLESSQGAVGKEVIYDAIVGKLGITYVVYTGGCTQRADFTVTQLEKMPVGLVLERNKADNCRALIKEGQEVFFSWQQLGLSADAEFTLDNEQAQAPVSTLALPREFHCSTVAHNLPLGADVPVTSVGVSGTRGADCDGNGVQLAVNVSTTGGLVAQPAGDGFLGKDYFMSGCSERGARDFELSGDVKGAFKAELGDASAFKAVLTVGSRSYNVSCKAK